MLYAERAEIDEILAKSAAIRKRFQLLMAQNSRIRTELFEIAKNSHVSVGPATTPEAGNE